MTVSLEDQIKCVARELTMRRNCYPGWVKGGELKQETADTELARMEAVLETLKTLQSESLKVALPGGGMRVHYPPREEPDGEG